MNRFKTVIALNIPLGIYFVLKLKHSSKKDPEKWLERYRDCRWVVLKILSKSRIKVNAFGIENLPKEDGYMICPNHQSSFDGLAIIGTHERQLSVALDEARSNIIMEKQFMDAIHAKRLDKTNPKKMFKPMKELAENIKNGKNYIVFPEGKWGDNKNTLQEFYTGCFHFMKPTEKPIVPVCLYNCFKVYQEDGMHKVTAQIHYLKPIYYEEYKDLSKQEIADLVKGRIQEKLDELIRLDAYADKKNLTELPVVRQNKLTGEKEAGFVNRQTGEFKQIMIINNEYDLVKFAEEFKVDLDDDMKISY